MSKKIKKAIISLSDKSEIKSILKVLKKYNVKIISSGGTSKEIKSWVISVLKCQNLQNLVKF